MRSTKFSHPNQIFNLTIRSKSQFLKLNSPRSRKLRKCTFNSPTLLDRTSTPLKSKILPLRPGSTIYRKLVTLLSAESSTSTTRAVKDTRVLRTTTVPRYSQKEQYTYFLLPGRSSTGRVRTCAAIRRSHFFLASSRAIFTSLLHSTISHLSRRYTIQRDLTGRQLTLRVQNFLNCTLPDLSTNQRERLARAYLKLRRVRNHKRKTKRRRKFLGRGLSTPQLSHLDHLVPNINFRDLWIERSALSGKRSANYSIFNSERSDSIIYTLSMRYKDYPQSFNLLWLVPHKYIAQRILGLLSYPSTVKFLTGSNLLLKWTEFTQTYISIHILPHLELYLTARKTQKRSAVHLLRFRFKQHSLVVTLADAKTNSTRLFVTPGLFIKYFSQRKSLKRHKALKLVLIRFLRKMILVLKLQNIILHLRGVPLFIELFLDFLYRPLAHLFTDPFTGKVIDEVRGKRAPIDFAKLEIWNPKPFGSQKQKKRGRIKRKVRRKIFGGNSGTDV